MRVRSLAAVVLGMVAGAATAQVSGARTAPPVKPYTMAQSITTTHSYANGMTSTDTLRVVSVRDSARRTRYEREMSGWPAMTINRDGKMTHSEGRPKVTFISVSDPVMNVFMNWSDDAAAVKEVRVTRQRAAAAGPRRQTTAQKTDDGIVAEEHLEHLGTRAIEGVIAEGTRWTMKYPAGAFGMSQEFTVTREDWTARDYGVSVESTLDDPRTGKTVTTLLSFSDQEPDAAMFKLPDGYAVVSDTRVEAVAAKQ